MTRTKEPSIRVTVISPTEFCYVRFCRVLELRGLSWQKVAGVISGNMHKNLSIMASLDWIEKKKKELIL